MNNRQLLKTVKEILNSHQMGVNWIFSDKRTYGRRYKIYINSLGSTHTRKVVINKIDQLLIHLSRHVSGKPACWWREDALAVHVSP